MKKSAPILLLIILFVTMAWYFLTKEPDEVHELPPPHIPPAIPVIEQQAEPAPPVEDSIGYVEPEPVALPDPLSPLNESDPQFSESLTEIVGTDPLAEYLIKSQAISRLVATIDSLTSRQIPPQINPVKPADDKFIVDTEGESVVMSTQNFARYDGYVALLQNADSDALMTVYQRYYPLFQQAWEENGGEGSFNERLTGVIDDLLETPDVPGPIYLSKPEAVYLFDDPALESMTAGQKILVRMGPANASIVKEKLEEVRMELN
jgi:hypothetical protein